MNSTASGRPDGYTRYLCHLYSSSSAPGGGAGRAGCSSTTDTRDEDSPCSRWPPPPDSQGILWPPRSCPPPRDDCPVDVSSIGLGMVSPRLPPSCCVEDGLVS